MSMSSEEVELDAAATAELATLQPSRAELRWLHGITVFYLLLTLLIGLPLWWCTTAPVQFPLPTDELALLSRHPISIGVNVVIINFDEAGLPTDALSQLQADLYLAASDAQRRLAEEQRHKREEELGTDLSGLSVSVDYRFLLQKMTQSINLTNYQDGSFTQNAFERDLLQSWLLNRLWDQQTGLEIKDAYFFVILPTDFPGFLATKDQVGVVRSSAERNLIYLRSLCSPTSQSACAADLSTLAAIIFDLLQECLVVPTKLQATFESVWWKNMDVNSLAPNRKNNNGETVKTMSSARVNLAHVRTHNLPPAAGYDISISLVSAFMTSSLPPPTDTWLPGGKSFGQWLEAEVIQYGLASLARYIHLDVNSQYIYSVSLDTLQWSRLSKDRTYRFYNSTQLSNLLNELEGHLGQHLRRPHDDDTLDEFSGANGLHLVVVFDMPPPSAGDNTTRRPLRFHPTNKDGEVVPSSIVVVPQWGAVISVDEIDVSLGNLGRVLVNTVRSLVGVSTHRRSHRHVKLPSVSRDVLFEKSDDLELAKWELDAWLRFQTIESLSTTSLTLTSLVNMVHSIPYMVIQNHVAERVHQSARAWGEAVDALLLLPSSSTSNLLDAGFLHAQTALKRADAAFFDHSILSRLYFPADQIYGIYVPLLVPILIPMLSMGVAAFKFFKSGSKDAKPKEQ